MSAWERTKQFNAFTRIWHLFDAKWQNPYECAPIIGHYLKGLYKPIYHAMSDCGDHVVVINSKQISLPGQEWRWRVYYHDTGFAKGKSYTRAWELHDKDPRLVVRKAVYSILGHNLQRRHTMERLHIYPDANVPKEMMENITNQIRPLQKIPRLLNTYSEKEIEEFPKIFDYPEDYIIR